MEVSLDEALLPKQEEPEKTKTWRHWALACVCLVLSCLNAACFVYGSRVPISISAAVPPCTTNDRIPWKELLYLSAIPISFFFGLISPIGLILQILDTKSKKHNLKAIYEANPDGSQGYIIDLNLYESHYLGTDLYKEVACDVTEWTFKFCAFVYAVAFFLEVFFNMFEASRLFSIALIILFSSALAFLFGYSFILNTKIALRLGEKTQNIV